MPIGVNFVNNPAALELWRNACEIEGERVRIPRGLAPQLCATAATPIYATCRNPARNVVVAARIWLWPPSNGPPFRAIDAKGAAAYATMEIS